MSFSEASMTQAASALQDLLPEAIEILRAAAKGTGTVVPVDFDGGFAAIAGAEQFDFRDDRRKMAALRRAVEQLVQLGLIEGDGRSYDVSDNGFQLVDNLTAGRISMMLSDKEKTVARYLRDFFVEHGEPSHLNATRVRPHALMEECGVAENEYKEIIRRFQSYGFAEELLRTGAGDWIRIDQSIIRLLDQIEEESNKAMFDKFHTDVVRLVKPDGQAFEDIQASVQSKKIFIDDADLPIEEGDRIERTLPNGLAESYLVLDRGFFQGMGGIGPHYQIKVEKETTVSSKGARPNVTIHQHGPATKVNVNSTDNSTNTFNLQSSQVFADARQLIQQEITDVGQRDMLLQRLEALEDSQNTPTFKERYKEFIADAANHVSVLGPVIAGLSQLL